MQIGYVVRAYRTTRGWSQAKLADLIQNDQSYISKLEKNLIAPSLSNAKAIADAFGVTVDELLQSPLEPVEAS